MDAVAHMEKPMAKDRIARLESDVAELKSNVKAIDTRLSEFIVATAKELGAIKASIKSAKLWMLVTGVGSVILITFASFLGHALKLF